MPVPLGDQVFAVAALHAAARGDGAGVGPQTQRAALTDAVALIQQKVDHLVGRLGVQLAGAGVRQPADMAGKFDDGHLHPKADAQIGDVLLPGIAGGDDHALHPPIAEAAGDDDPITAGKHRGHSFLRHGLAVDPADVDRGAAGIARVAQGLRHGQIGVVQLHILAHQADGDLSVQALDPLYQGLPLVQRRSSRPEPQLPADDQGKVVLLQHQRRLVQHRQGQVFDDAVGFDVAEHGDLVEDRLLQRFVAAQHDDVRGDAHALQFLDGVLGGFGLVLVAAPQEGHQRYMNEQGVVLALLQADLTRGLQKGLALDVAGGAADFGDDHVGPGLAAYAVDEVLDLLGDVGDDLHGLPQVLAPALLVEHIPIDLAGCQVGVLVQVFVDEALVVAQVQVRLGAVLGHIDLAVLIGAHGSRVHIDVGVQLLSGHLQPPALEETAQRGRGDSLAQTGHHAAGHENVLCHRFFLSASCKFTHEKNVLRCLKGALGPLHQRTSRKKKKPS